MLRALEGLLAKIGLILLSTCWRHIVQYNSLLGSGPRGGDRGEEGRGEGRGCPGRCVFVVRHVRFSAELHVPA